MVKYDIDKLGKLDFNSSKTKQYLYLVKSELGFTKIGITAEPKKRIKVLMSQSGMNIDVVRMFLSEPEIDTCVKLTERYLHNHFKEKRVKGEWFNLSNYQVAKAIKLLSEGSYLEDVTVFYTG